MTRKKMSTLAIVTTLCGVPLFAAAQPGHGRGMGERFEQLDRNGDGSVSLSELSAGIAARFAKADANADGRVTKQELSAAHQARMQQHAQKRDDKRVEQMQKMFEKLDRNDDGKISRSEAERMPQARFDALDRDRDGSVTPQEIAEGRSEQHKRMRAHAGARAAGVEKRFGRFDQNADGAIDKPEIQQLAKARFEKLDGDKNGAIDKPEIQQLAKARFEKLDGDKNGALSKQELRPAHHGLRRHAGRDGAAHGKFEAKKQGKLERRGGEKQVAPKAPASERAATASKGRT